MKLIDIKQPVQENLLQLDRVIRDNLPSNVSLINDIALHILNTSGKRLRPLLVLLSATACNYNNEAKILMAAAIEFIHTATLLHDDVVDASTLRRGKSTANDIWGNKESILVGDYLYSKAFALMSKIKDLEIFDLMAKTTSKIAEGEVMQLESKNDSKVSEAFYMEIITNKTARLFKASAEAGAILAMQDTKTQDTETHNSSMREALATYGLHFGTAFQLIDDVLDYISLSPKFGKNIGDDLAEGKMTLPLIQALKTCDTKDKVIIENAIKTGNIKDLDKIQDIIFSTKAIEYTVKIAQEEINKAKAAINILPDSIYKNSLLQLADFIVIRKY